jgi:hypothetical protein
MQFLLPSFPNIWTLLHFERNMITKIFVPEAKSNWWGRPFMRICLPQLPRVWISGSVVLVAKCGENWVESRPLSALLSGNACSSLFRLLCTQPCTRSCRIVTANAKPQNGMFPYENGNCTTENIRPLCPYIQCGYSVKPQILRSFGFEFWSGRKLFMSVL